MKFLRGGRRASSSSIHLVGLLGCVRSGGGWCWGVCYLLHNKGDRGSYVITEHHPYPHHNKTENALLH